MELWRERLEPLDASVQRNISTDEHLPAGAEHPWTTWKALNRLRTQVGRSRVNMLKLGYIETNQKPCNIYLVPPPPPPCHKHSQLYPRPDSGKWHPGSCARHWGGGGWGHDLTDMGLRWKENNDYDHNISSFFTWSPGNA